MVRTIFCGILQVHSNGRDKEKEKLKRRDKEKKRSRREVEEKRRRDEPVSPMMMYLNRYA